MRWVDVAGSPGAGKSALCDSTWTRKPAWDGGPIPADWTSFADCAEEFIDRIEPAGAEVCRAIMERSLRKLATLQRKTDAGAYINTGVAQLGLEIGWRLGSDCVVRFFEEMPVSIGVVFLWTDPETLRARNRARSRDRSHMVDGMERTRTVAEGVLARRGVRVLSLDTSLPIDAVKARLLKFANE